ncbi:hypothetical protein COLO4_12027 [Corchorus olitorius]|uniref:RNase H type-1 domain-containing protein n=1 Tax=Corchorus olitorius TaxID=93759 RepID=A0A1R3K2E1_9ROSI|nr:hypothetical protein COLO4_12027 [Corchorus olitorius]
MKLRHYLINEQVDLICKYDVIKYMLNKPVMGNRIGKWVLALSEFSLNFVPQKAVKGQALADFLADHPCQVTLPKLDETMLVEPIPWILEFDGSKTELGAGAGIVLTSPSGKIFKFSFSLLFKCSNNQAEYEALIAGLELLIDLKAYSILIKGNSQLVIGQLTGIYQCISPVMRSYYKIDQNLLSQFSETKFEFVYREENSPANELAQDGSGYKKTDLIEFRPQPLDSALTRICEENQVCEITTLTSSEDWRTPIKQYLQNPDGSYDYIVKIRAMQYCLMKDGLFKRGTDGILLKCIDTKESMRVMAEVHEGCADYIKLERK